MIVTIAIITLVRSGFAEPMTTHADHYSTNYAYSQNAYSKGAVFISQLGYITGDKVSDEILLEYYHNGGLNILIRTILYVLPKK